MAEPLGEEAAEGEGGDGGERVKLTGGGSKRGVINFRINFINFEPEVRKSRTTSVRPLWRPARLGPCQRRGAEIRRA